LKYNVDSLCQTGPDVIPIDIVGGIDTDTSKLTASELMTWGLANLWKEGREGGYFVRHGKQPVNDFGCPCAGDDPCPAKRLNFFARAFPGLFPYGEGGIEGEPTVDFAEHIRWALHYHDRRFRRHPTFSFVAFGITQRRQVLSSTRVQMSCKTFDKDAYLLSTLTLERLQKAQEVEEKNVPISDPLIQLLRKHVYATGGHVVGSDYSRFQLHSQIWSTSIMLNPPSLWITINPCDLHDPIAQVLAGENINLDDLRQKIGPSKEKRAENMALDPYTAAKFFHFLVRTILTTLLGVEATTQCVHTHMGIFGKVVGYFGLVESQGRGTLHLHLLVWLKNTLVSETIEELLRGEDFHQKIRNFIKENIRAYLPGFESAEELKKIPNDVEVAYSRPPNPQSANYDAEIVDLERRVAHSKQHHTCEVRRCLIMDYKGRWVCKQHAPFQTADDDFVDEQGWWGMKRLYEFMNTWVPAITVNACCNNNIKLLTNSKETTNISFYITAYSTKKQG